MLGACGSCEPCRNARDTTGERCLRRRCNAWDKPALETRLVPIMPDYQVQGGLFIAHMSIYGNNHYYMIAPSPTMPDYQVQEILDDRGAHGISPCDKEYLVEWSQGEKPGAEVVWPYYYHIWTYNPRFYSHY